MSLRYFSGSGPHACLSHPFASPSRPRVAGLATMAQPQANSLQSLDSGWSTWRTKWSGVALGVPVYCTLANTGGRGEMEVDC